MKYRLSIRTVLLILIIAMASQSFVYGQGSGPASGTKEDGRFSVNIKNVPVSTTEDPVGLMRSFDINVQWWTLLGEPIEYYDIRWFSSGKYKIGDRWIYREKLEKYPDLLKRFDNLRPYKFSIKIIGAADGGVVSVKRGTVPEYADYYRKASPYKENGQSYDRYYLDADFYYVVEDRKILVTKAGKIGHGISPGSPHWNEFIYWGSYDPFLYGIQESNKEDKVLENRNKQLFKKTDKIILKAETHELEWPEYELRGIAEQYDKYENGEEEPSPKEIVEERKKKEVDKLNEYAKNDFWKEPEVVKKPKLVMIYNHKKQGYKYEGTEKIIIPAIYERVEKEGDFFKVKDGTVEEIFDGDPESYAGKLYNNSYCCVFNSSGIKIINEPFKDFYHVDGDHSFYKNESGYILIRILEHVTRGYSKTSAYIKKEIIYYDSNMKLIKKEVCDNYDPCK